LFFLKKLKSKVREEEKGKKEEENVLEPRDSARESIEACFPIFFFGVSSTTGFFSGTGSTTVMTINDGERRKRRKKKKKK
jgi:hypothetical protein